MVIKNMLGRYIINTLKLFEIVFIYGACIGLVFFGFCNITFQPIPIALLSNLVHLTLGAFFLLSIINGFYFTLKFDKFGKLKLLEKIIENKLLFNVTPIPDKWFLSLRIIRGTLYEGIVIFYFTGWKNIYIELYMQNTKEKENILKKINRFDFCLSILHVASLIFLMIVSVIYVYK
jgi:hypothetical protein